MEFMCFMYVPTYLLYIFSDYTLVVGETGRGWGRGCHVTRRRKGPFEMEGPLSEQIKRGATETRSRGGDCVPSEGHL